MSRALSSKLDHDALIARTRALIGESRRLLDEAGRDSRRDMASEHLKHRAWWAALLARGAEQLPPPIAR